MYYKHSTEKISTKQQDELKGELKNKLIIASVTLFQLVKHL